MALHPRRLTPHLACLAAALTVVLGSTPALAQQPQPPKTAPAAPPPARQIAATPQPLQNEPVVQHIIIEDDGTRIEELHVRGEAQRIKVQPKGLSPRFSYEVLPASGARDLSPGPGSTRGAAGERVWSVLSF